jgi:hypothetical protein
MRLLFADGADSAAHGLAASEGDFARPELRAWFSCAGDAFASTAAGGIVGNETAHRDTSTLCR